MIQRALRLTAFTCCALVLTSFGLFARDQLASASQNQQNQLVGPPPGKTPPSAALRHQPAQPRRFIDGAARALTSPFRSIVQTDSQWVLHIFPTVLALLLYGAGLGYLARYSRGWGGPADAPA